MSIQGNAFLMLDDLDSSDHNVSSLINIENAVQSGAKLTRQLLGYARKGKYVVRPICLNQIIKETTDAFSRTRKEISIHCQLDEDLSLIDADEGQMEQIVLNLYVNASDAMRGGGDLILSTQNVADEDMKGRLYSPKAGNYVKFTIADTGIGMDEDTQERIFDPFFTTKEMGRGTGLGLASVYGIIKSHGGYIDVDSEEGQGTTFSIFLPVSEKEGHKENKSTKHIIEGSGTILLVDDEEQVLEVGSKLIKRIGYKVFVAKSGSEAIDVYNENKAKIDLIILDMIMPKMGGGETYDKMKRIDSNVKVLLSSGYSIDGEAAEIIKRGCNSFIQKPFSMKDLSVKIDEVLAN
jgi:CheY-like chemotaxis protein